LNALSRVPLGPLTVTVLAFTVTVTKNRERTKERERERGGEGNLVRRKCLCREKIFSLLIAIERMYKRTSIWNCYLTRGKDSLHIELKDYQEEMGGREEVKEKG
jgi:hypothetical protein